ncbi:Aureobasidin resistance protein Aur1 [Ceratobasidium sp. UAMH 11750]|nr:Aureobasidin resistance protein Aur1 [Ceratobasidium sp. UAMH 11750]
MNLTGVLIQLVFPCAPPWYELIYGLTPANYAVRGDPGGLARIDALFHSSGYSDGFSSSPLVFGAFPSLHSGSATIEVLFVSHFFPRLRRHIWCYALVLYWSTMYLTQHYLINVVAGTCLAIFAFYFFLPRSLRTPHDTPSPFASKNHSSLFTSGNLGMERTDNEMGPCP